MNREVFTAVSNNQLANQDTFNNAFMSRTVNTSTTGTVNLDNITDVNSGAEIFNAQRYVNEVADSDGTSGEGDATRKTYSSNNVVANGDNRKVAIGKLDATFNTVSGHDHDGIDSKQVSATNLSNINQFKADWQTTTFTGASGLTTDVSTAFSGKVSGGTATQAGVITTTDFNRVHLQDQSTETNLEDTNGQQIYGRITEAAGIFILTYFTNEAGVETAHSLSSTNIRIFYREVFTLATFPTIGSDLGRIESLDYTADIVDATATQRGLVSTGTQSFAGTKTFTGDVNIDGATRLATSLTGFLKATAGVVSAQAQINLASDVTGTLPEANGGTGESTYTTGDILYSNATNLLAKLPIGSTNQVLTTIGGIPSWQTPASSANLAVRTVTTTDTATNADDLILCDSSGGSFTETLFTAVGNTGKILRLKKTTSDNNIITIDADGTQTIDGSLTRKLATQDEEYTIVSDGSNWKILSHTYPSGLVAYTPTFTGFGTVSTINVYSRRVGDSLNIVGRFTSGVSTGTEARISIGHNGVNGGITSATITNIRLAGYTIRSSAAAVAFNTLIESAVTYITFGIQDGTRAGLTKQNGDQIAIDTVSVSFEAFVPINNWEG